MISTVLVRQQRTYLCIGVVIVLKCVVVLRVRAQSPRIGKENSLRRTSCHTRHRRPVSGPVHQRFRLSDPFRSLAPGLTSVPWALLVF